MKIMAIVHRCKFALVLIILGALAPLKTSAICMNCYMDSKTADAYLSKWCFKEYTNVHWPLVKMYHHQKTHSTYYCYYYNTGTNGAENTNPGYYRYENTLNEDKTEDEYYLGANYSYTNQYSGSESYVEDDKDDRRFENGNNTFGDSGWSGLLFNMHETQGSPAWVQLGNDWNWGFLDVTTNTSHMDEYWGAGYNWSPWDTTNGTAGYIVASIRTGDLMVGETQTERDYVYSNATNSTTGSDDAGYTTSIISGNTTMTLDQEYTDSELCANIMAIMPAYPTNWNSGSGQAYSYIDNSHGYDRYASGTKLKYRFKLPPKTETNMTYKVNWDIITKQKYNISTNITTSVDTNYSETLTGTGDPSNYVYGVEHEIAVPPFYCTDDTGGYCEKYVANVTITDSAGNAIGSGPGGGNEGGGGCRGCSKGSVAHDGGMQAEFGLGYTTAGQAVGNLRIWAAIPSPSQVTPDGLKFEGNPDAATIIYVNTNQIRQVLAPQALVDVVVSNAFSYSLNYYYPSQIGSQVGGLYQVSGSPFVTWNILNPYGTNSTNTVLVTETRGSSSWVYSYVYNPTDNSWTYGSPGNLWQTQLITSNNAANGTRTLIQIVSQTNGMPAKIFSRTYAEYSWGEGVISETEGTGATAKTTTKTYYDGYAANGTFVPLQQVIHPDGSWEYYYYTQLADGSYAPFYIYRGFGDEPPSTSSGTATWYDYTPLGDDHGTQMPTAPRTVVEDVGREVSRTYLVMLPGERRDIRCVHAYDRWDNPNNLVTITKYYDGSNAFRVKSIQNPDGTMSFYNYAQATNGWQTNTFSTGQPNGGPTAIVDGTQTTTILDAFGQTVSVTVQNISSGVVGAVLQQDVYGNFDPLDRAQRVTHLDGTSETYDYACCYLDGMTDREGVTTHYLHDAAKRQFGYERYYDNSGKCITFSNTLDAAGRTLKAYRVGTNNTIILQSQSAYDLAGRLVVQTNALNGVTSYAESTDATTGGLIRTTTNPDGGTRIEAYFVDGTLKSVTGTAVHGKAYGYGVEYPDIGDYCSYTVETNLDASRNLTSEWTKTYTDRVGRTTETRRGDDFYDSNWKLQRPISCSFYNTAGQLWKQVDPDGVTTLYIYNGKGEQSFNITAVSDDTKNISDYPTLVSSLGSIQGGVDRITQTTNDVTADQGNTVRRSQTFVWLDGQSTPTLAAVSEVCTNGLQSWQVKYGEASSGKPVTNSSVTSISGSSRSTITIAPDGSYTINTYAYGRLIASTRYDATRTNQLGGTSYSYDAHGRQYQVTDVRNGTTTYGYTDSDQVSSVTTPVPGGGAAAETTTTLFDNLLRPYSVIQPDGTTVNTIYLLTGELGLQYGSRTYRQAEEAANGGSLPEQGDWSCLNVATLVGYFMTPTPHCWKCHREDRWNSWPGVFAHDLNFVVCESTPQTGTSQKIVFDYWHNAPPAGSYNNYISKYPTQGINPDLNYKSTDFSTPQNWKADNSVLSGTGGMAP